MCSLLSNLEMNKGPSLSVHSDVLFSRGNQWHMYARSVPQFPFEITRETYLSLISKSSSPRQRPRDSSDCTVLPMYLLSLCRERERQSKRQKDIRTAIWEGTIDRKRGKKTKRYLRTRCVCCCALCVEKEKERRRDKQIFARAKTFCVVEVSKMIYRFPFFTIYLLSMWKQWEKRLYACATSVLWRYLQICACEASDIGTGCAIERTRECIFLCGVAVENVIIQYLFFFSCLSFTAFLCRLLIYVSKSTLTK